MRLERAHIEGYRSLREVSIPFERLTSCIGPNGTGKSSVLGALRLFFTPSATVEDHDYWCGHGEPVEEIAIKLTFSDLTADEQTRFESFLNTAQQLVVERRFEKGGSATYLGHRLAVPEFSTIRMLDRAHRVKFNELVESGDFEGLEKANNKDEVLENMRSWEVANPERCDVLEVEFEPLTELLEAISFLAVGALENPADHVEAHGKGAVAELLAKVIDHRAVQSQLDNIAAEATEQSQALLREASDGFRRFAASMKDQLLRFAPGFNLNVDWSRPRVQGVKPSLQVSIQTADGLDRPLQNQGHGVQRALMYAALTAQVEAGADTEHDRILLMIEEPEAFQHPLSCRVLSATLRELSQRNYQVIYSTHSPYFIHPELVGGLRIFRREDQTGSGASTNVESLDEERLLQEWRRIFEVVDATTTSVLTRLQAHLPATVLEGLFARLCMLVEGPEDEAVVRTAASRSGLDLDSAGIGVVQTNGKPAMPNVLTFLSLAGVKVYPVFDLDRQREAHNQNRDAERQIMRALNIEGEPTVGVGERYACWEKNITQQLREELGDSYDEALAQAAASCGYSIDRGRKVPAVVTELLRFTEAWGRTSQTVMDIGERLSQIIGDLPFAAEIAAATSPNPVSTVTGSD